MPHPFKIGILIDNLRLGVKGGIRKAKELGVDGVQVWCVDNELAPERMPAPDRAAFKCWVAEQGLEISALCGDLGKGFLNAESNRQIVPRMKTFVDLAADLGVRIVTSHIGRLPEDERDPCWAIGRDAFEDLGAYAAGRGCVVAMETGPEEPIVLKRFLDTIGNKGIGVNYDPANLVMGGPYDHIGGVRVLKDYIVHTHAKDGVRLLSERTAGGDRMKRRVKEVPLGEGSVAFRYYLWSLKEIGYAGFLTIEREGGEDPVGDVARAVSFLRGLEPWDGLVYRPKQGGLVPIEWPAV